MKKFYTSFFSALFLLLCSIAASAQISVTATAATTGPTVYTTLKGAFDAINAGTHKGVITISINGNTTETATANLLASAGTSSYTSIAINATGTFTINSNVGGPAIQLNGADNVNLNGNNTLQILTTNPAGTAITFVNDATNNIIRNTKIKGSTAIFTGSTAAPSITGGLVHFGSGTTTGNDNNTIDNCDLDGGNNAICLLFSAGTPVVSTTPDNLGFNSGNTVKDCKLHDYISPSIAGGIALYLRSSNTEWTIQNNSVYFTAPLITDQQFLFRGMLIAPSFTNDFHTVTGNFVGGNAPAAAGMMTVAAGSNNALGYIGLDIETGGPGNTVSNNTVKNINFSYAFTGGSYTNAGIFGFIGGYNGTTTFTGNTVSNITFANTDGFIQFNAIHMNGRVSRSVATTPATITPLFNVTNNTVNAITLNSGGVGGDIALMGIRLETSSAQDLTAGTDKSNPTFNVTGNTVSNLSTSFTGNVASYIRGIATSTAQGVNSTTGISSAAQLHPDVNISNNTIHTFSNASAVGNVNPATSTNANYGTPVVVGINFGGSSGSTSNTTDTTRIVGNTIYNLAATNTGDHGAVATGILASTGILHITNNKVYDLRNSSSGASYSPAPGIVGINVRRTDGAANSLVANNMVSLGTNVTNNIQIFGLLNNFTNATGPLNIYYNSFVVTGAGAAGNTKITSAYHRGTETQGIDVVTPTVLKNNILYNSRTGGGSHYAVVNTHTTPATGFTSDWNNLYSANAATVARWGATNQTLAAYKTASGDVNSKSVTVTFVNPATGDLHLSGASITDANLKAVPVGGITTDFDNDARSATTPTMGADEGSNTPCVAPSITSQPTAQASCAGSPATFTVAGSGTALTYQWRKAGVNINGATAATYTIAAVAAGDAANYDVVITGQCGTVTSNAVALTVNPKPTATITGGSFCNTGSTTLTVTGQGGGTFSATPAGLAITPSTGAINLAGSTPGAYTVKYVFSNGTCSDSTTSNVTVSNATVISTQPTAQAACAGSPATFTVVATGANLTYQWRKAGVNINGATSSSYTIASVSAADVAAYDVVIGSSCGASVTSNSANLTLNTPVTITTQPTSQTVCAGTNPSLSVVANGSGTLTYQWRKAGANIAGATSATYTITGATVANSGNYDVVVTGACGSVTSSAIALTVNPATTITTQPSNVTVCAGATATFTAAATGTGTVTYQWRKAGVNIAGATNATYSIVNAATTDAGSYTVVATSTCGTATSNAATLTVNTGGSCPTALPNIDADVTGAKLMPSVVRNSTVLRVNMRRSMKIDWVISDASGRVVMAMSRPAAAGQSDITLDLSALPAGTYQVTGTTLKGRTAVLRFVKQ